MMEQECCCNQMMMEGLSSAQFTVVSDTATVRASFSSSISTLTEKRLDSDQHNFLASHENKARRRVRFANSPKGDGGVLTDVRIFVANDEQNDRSFPEVIMTHTDGDHDPIGHFAKYQEDAMNAIAEDGCRTLLDSMDKMYFGTAVDPADKGAEEKRMTAMACWAKIQDGKYRGLEATLMKRAFQRRISHRKKILEKQQTLRYQAPASTVAAQLRHISRKYSRTSSEFAMFLAVGDSIVVNGHEILLSDQPLVDTAVMAVTQAEL